MSPELQRIQNDLARAKERVSQIEAGTRGVRSGPWLSVDGDQPGAGLACTAQLKAQRDTVERLELELVNACIPRIWHPAAVIAAMAPRPAVPAPTIVTETVTVFADETRQALERLLAGPDKFFSRTTLKELIA